jgi:cytochrome o ubiquinol oxidase subunit I
LCPPSGLGDGYLPPEHYDQIFSAHGTIMIFFVAMPFVVGLMNFVLPLQLGVRDVALPVLDSGSFWLTATSVLLVNLPLVIGEFARTGWLAYPPLSEIAYSPGVGVDGAVRSKSTDSGGALPFRWLSICIGSEWRCK